MALDDGGESNRFVKQQRGLELGDMDSDAIRYFNEKFRQTREEIHALNPIKGCVAGAKWSDAPLSLPCIDSQDEDDERDRRMRVLQGFLKSAIVNTMVVFEGYVHDLFTEAFEYTYWSEEDRKDRKECEESWPAVKNLVIRQVANYKDKLPELYNIVRDEDVWGYLIRKHRDDSLGDLGPTITKMKTTLTRLFVLTDKPISLLPKEDHSLKIEKGSPLNNAPTDSPQSRRRMKSGDKDAKQRAKQQGTDSQPTKNKQGDAQDATTDNYLKEFPLEIMLKHKSFSTKWQIPSRDREKFTDFNVVITDLDVLTHILNLFYAIRCIAVHGRAQPTIEGVLNRFPKGQDRTLNLGCAAVEEYLFEIYDSIGDLQVDYHLCINVTRFIRTVAINLQRALGYFIYYQLKLSRKFTFYFPGEHKFWGLKMYEGDKLDVPHGKAMKTGPVGSGAAAAADDIDDD